MLILAIETSCDETGIAILEHKKNNFRILSNVVSSQVKLHAKWGGVVPGLAKREHQRNLVPVLNRALKEAKLLNPKLETRNPKQTQNTKYKILNTILEREPELLKKTTAFLKKYKKPRIDLIAVVNGPGLEPALWMGVNFAKALSTAWDKPLVPINHLEGHLYSIFLEKNREFSISNFQFPAIALLVSGGHTQIVLVKDWLKYKILGQTRDDAAGEAFDKVAKMLGLGYPGGPAIAKLASQWKLQATSHKLQARLPRPMINSKDYDFSFSGLKTAVLYKVKDLKPMSYKLKTGLCAEFQQATIDVLTSKTIRAAKEYKAKTIILAGGVSANRELRHQMEKAVQENIPDSTFYIPNSSFTGDNAAMMALAAHFRWQNKKEPANLRALKANGNLKLS